MAEIQSQPVVGAASSVRLGANAQDLPDDAHVSLCETIDRLLHKGVVLRGEVAISVAGIDLVYLSLQVLLASTDSARSFIAPSQSPITNPTLVVSTGANRAALPGA